MPSLDDTLDNYYPKLIFFKVPIKYHDTLTEYKAKNILTKTSWDYLYPSGGSAHFSTYDDYCVWANAFCEEKYIDYIATTHEIKKIPVVSLDDEEEQIRLAKEKGWEYIYV